ncbi:MAG TPA: cytochrome c maturation protein CcmE [Candidatus Methanoperedenaceae archaeon]|nr:cytochrome c maturation protein CcmE [Candidatus Methanoperedenaceae archaeon]
MNSRRRAILGLILIIVFVAYAAYSFTGAISGFMEVSEFKANPFYNKTVNINGTIKLNSTLFEPEVARLSFTLTDGVSDIPVVYRQGMPGNYREGIPAVVTGKYRDGIFEASTVITKCPSKYGANIEHPENHTEENGVK